MEKLSSPKTIAILYICTGKYSVFWKDFFTSCEKYFIPEMEKEYFVFTDASSIEFEEQNSRIHRVFQKNLGWPGNTLKRFEMFLGIEKVLKEFDYLIFFNANAVFLQKITSMEFLPQNSYKLIAWQHTGFLNKNKNEFTYDRNPRSSAYIPFNTGEYYFGGGIAGGTAEEYLKAILELKNDIKENEKNHLTALWHDESHWNKYLIDKTSITKILGPTYIASESDTGLIRPKILFRDKRKHGNLIFKLFIYWKIGYFSINELYKFLKRKIKNIFL